MLRINLLPRYIEENAQKKKWIAAWVVGLVLVIGLFGAKITDLNKDLTAATQAQDEANSNKTKYDDYDTKIKKVNDDVAKIKEKQDFIANAQKYNEGWPTVYNLMRDVTSSSILLKSLNIDPATHKTLNFTGFAKDELTIVRWWMYLRNNTDKFDSVFFNLPTHPYVPTAGNTVASAGFPGGGAGGFPGGRMGGGGMPQGMQQQMMMGMMGGRMGGGGFPGGRMGGGNTGATGADVVEGRPGLSFTALAVLKQPMAGGIPAPVWSAGGGGASTGMGASMPGMPPGMMGGGMPPGMMPGMQGGPGRAGRMGGGKAGGD